MTLNSTRLVLKSDVKQIAAFNASHNLTKLNHFMLMIFLRGNSTVIHRLVVATCCCVRYIFKSGEEKIKEVIFSQEDWLPTCLQAPCYKTGMHL